MTLPSPENLVKCQDGSLQKVFILLMTAPILNIIAVIITLERKQEITFAQAKFGGMAVGVNENLSHVSVQKFADLCFSVPFKVKNHQQVKVSFFRCENIIDPKDSEGSWMSVGRGLNDEVILTLVVSGIQYDFQVYYALMVGQDIFGIRQMTSEKMLRVLLEYGNRRLSKFCLRNDSRADDTVVREDDESVMRLSRNVSCTQMGGFASIAVLGDMIERVTLVDANSFEVAQESNRTGERPEYMRADDIVLLEQQSSFVGLGTLFVATGCVVLLRVIVKLVTQNDVHDGISILLRTCFGVQPGDSLLRWTGTVRYDHKQQEGDIAHLGVKIEDMQEVKKFVGGKVGVVDTRPCVIVEKCITLSD